MSSTAPAQESIASALAREAHALVQVRPRRALALAERARATAADEGDVSAQLAALHVLGWAQRVVGDSRSARTLRAGIRLGERHGDPAGVGILRRQLAMTLMFDGRTRAARLEIDAAIGLLSGRDRARSEVHRLEIHRRSHSVDPEAHRRVCAAAAAALRVMRRDGDEMWEARLLFNRALLLLDRGELDAAEAGLRGAQAICVRLGAEAAVIDTGVALASLALVRGDLLSSLRMLEKVEEALPAGHLQHALVGWRAAALAQARLLPEARAQAAAYVEICSRTGHGDLVAPALLDFAAIATMSGDLAVADGFAARAVRSFAARGKTVDSALARVTRLRAQVAGRRVTRSALRSGLEAAAVLDAAGWRRDGLRARLVVARAALALGSVELARRQLTLALPLRARGTVVDRVELCHAQALLRVADGNRAGGERALAEGLRLLEEYRAALGAVELRATASGIGVALARDGLRLAVESGEPARILVWAERLRGNALRLPPVRAARDGKLGALQAELRRVAGRERDAAAHRQPARATGEQARLEAAIRSRTRLLQGEGSAGATAVRPREAALALGERALVEYVEVDGALGALTLAGGRLAFHELGPSAALAELEWLRFALRGLAAGGAGKRRAAASSNALISAAALDRLLVEPLLPAIGGAPLVIVPTGVLQGLPWSVLPSLRGRPLTVAPSLTVWLGLARLPRSRLRRTAVIAGPGLRHAAAEVREVAALLPGAIALEGKAATVATALTTLDGARIAHLACHGTFRADSPLFSALELADGPLNVYALQQLRRAPELVVLSACDLAVSDIRPGDELLGLSAALLGMGTRTIVASVVPVPDAASRRLMVAFHHGLAAGLRPAEALAQAQARLHDPSLSGFFCLGAG